MLLQSTPLRELQQVGRVKAVFPEQWQDVGRTQPVEWSSRGLPEIGAKLAEQHIPRAKDGLRTGRTTGGRPAEERGTPLREMLKADVRTNIGGGRGDLLGSLVNALGKPPMHPAFRRHILTPSDSGSLPPTAACFRLNSPSRQAIFSGTVSHEWIVYQFTKISLRPIHFDVASLAVSGIASNLGGCVGPISDAIFQNRNKCLQIVHVVRTNNDF